MWLQLDNRIVLWLVRLPAHGRVAGRAQWLYLWIGLRGQHRAEEDHRDVLDNRRSFERGLGGAQPVPKSPPIDCTRDSKLRTTFRPAARATSAADTRCHCADRPATRSPAPAAPAPPASARPPAGRPARA